MRHAGRVLRQAFGVAEADGAGDQLQRVHEAAARFDAALEFEGDHAAGQLHLPAREFALRERGQPRVVADLDLVVAGQAFGDGLGVAAVALHAQRQRLQAAQDEEGVLRGEHGAGHVLDAVEAHLVQRFLRADDGAGDEVAVAAEVFRRRMHDVVGAEFEGRCR
jgi:hypothetical protein